MTWRLKDDGSFVTELDRRVEDDLRARLLARFPGCEFLGEEGPAGVLDATRPRFILDPIDGTAAFARGLNFYAISLALLDADGSPHLAVLHLPGMGRWSVATFSEGRATPYAVVTTAAGTQVQPTAFAAPRLEFGDWRSAYLYLGSDPHRQLELSRWPGKVRALGATAAHLGLLLDDTIDPLAVIVTRYKIWDVAAGLALAEAAGFEMRDLAAPHKRLSLSDVARAAVLPALVVGRPVVLERLLRLIGVTRPRA